MAGLSRFFLRIRALVMLTTVALLSAAIALLVRTRFASPLAVVLLTALIGAPIYVALIWVLTRPIREIIFAVSNGLLSLREKDYSIRLAVKRRDEAGEMARRFNALGEVLRREHNDVYQYELLLETVLEAAPLASVLCYEDGTICHGNSTARALFRGGKRLEGERFERLLGEWPVEMRDAIASGRDALISIDRDGESQTFRVATRLFELSTQQFVLHLIEPLTRELARQEVEVWKKTIRIISHELNNSLAPITSLVHSARTVAGKPEHAHRLDGIFGTIEERAGHLKSFLDGYARFARLPKPSRQRVPWSDFVDGLRALFAFQLAYELPSEPGFFDPAQMQQVLINLLKNAIEAGGPADQVTLRIAGGDGGLELEVADRGAGMTDDVLRQALLPFYSTKKGGTGLGLPLCREIVEAHGGRLTIRRRDGGGTSVTCWLPVTGA